MNPSELAAAGQLEEAVVAKVKELDYVTWVEIVRLLRPHMKVDGDFALMIDESSNIVLWAGISEELSDLITKLIQEQRIFYHPASWMAYLIDGGILRFPLMKRARTYKKPHWAPVCFRVVPLEPKRGKKPTAPVKSK